MDSRSFTIGLTCGAVVGVAAGWFLGGEREEDVTTFAERRADSAVVQNEVHVAPTVPAASNNTQELATEPTRETGDAPAAEAAQEKSDPLASGRTRSGPVAPWPANLRAQLELEPKDDSWAYYMEQTLLQFLSTHASIQQFDISSIECRTTKCQIEVFGFDESAEPVWHQVMYDIRQQPWSDFGQYGLSSGPVDGRLVILSTLFRESESE